MEPLDHDQPVSGPRFCIYQARAKVSTRSKFIFQHYINGVTDFLDRYWEMIHLAAGWRALRTFLLVRLRVGAATVVLTIEQALCVRKYLTFDQVRQALQYYESKTGMKEWYKDDGAEPAAEA